MYLEIYIESTEKNLKNKCKIQSDRKVISWLQTGIKTFKIPSTQIDSYKRSQHIGGKIESFWKQRISFICCGSFFLECKNFRYDKNIWNFWCWDWESKSLKIRLKIFGKSNVVQLFVFNKSNKGPHQDTCLQIIKNYFWSLEH